MPTNLYGPNDNYNLETSHVLPALIRKMHLGKCLENNDWNALRKDLHKRPIEGIDGTATEEQILMTLAKYGITLDAPATRLASRVSHLESRVTRHASHVTITLWGTGQAYREFMHVDDMASACIFVMENINSSDLYANQSPVTSHQSPVTRHASRVSSFLNIGTGKDITIGELAGIIAKYIGFTGNINWDSEKPDGTPKKLLNVEKLQKLGWQSKISLEEGLRKVIINYPA